jgi:hypothetical protein
MENTLRVLNDLLDQRVLGQYAIGGAFGALFYTEPFLTEDLDVFCLVPASASPLMPFADVYEALKKRGYNFDGEFMSIEGVPVQFLPASTPLLEAALADAVAQRYGQTTTRVIGPEHLAAIALQTGRDKDYIRVDLLLRQAESFDVGLLKKLILEHGLSARWVTFKTRFPETATQVG